MIVTLVAERTVIGLGWQKSVLSERPSSKHDLLGFFCLSFSPKMDNSQRNRADHTNQTRVVFIEKKCLS